MALDSLANIKAADAAVDRLGSSGTFASTIYSTKTALSVTANTLFCQDGGGHPGSGVAMTFPNVSAELRHLIAAAAYRQGCSGFAILYDELSVGSTVSLTTTGNKTISTPALTRYTDGYGVEAWVVVTTAGTTTAPILSMNSYTDNDGNAGQVGHTTVTFGSATLSANNAYRLPVATGDQGVQAVSTINVATAGGGSAAAKVVLVKRLLTLPLAHVTAFPNATDTVLQMTAFPRIYDGAQLKWAVFLTASATVVFDAWIKTVVG